MKCRTIVLAAVLALTSSLALTQQALAQQTLAQPAPNAASPEGRRVLIRTPRGYCGPPDYVSVPRYCYDPRDDRVDTSPYAKPVAPVYGLECGGP